MMKSKNARKEIQRAALEFFDDADFCTIEIDSGRKMKEIVDCYSSMCEAAGGKAQKEKFMMHSWK